MNNDFFNFCLQQQGAGQRVLDKPTFYRDFILDPQLNGPGSVGILPSMTRIGPDITFTRTTSATFINQEGNIQVVDQNVPRFEWENHRTNLLSASNNFDNTNVWDGYWFRAPEWRQDAVGPDGVQNSAWSLPLSAAIYGPSSISTGLVQHINQFIPLSGYPLTVSFWAKVDANFTGSGGLWFGINDDGSNMDYTVGNRINTNWQRFVKTGNYINRNNNLNDRGIQFVILSASNTNPNSKVYVYGFQCEVGSTATPYISTGARPVTVSRPKGLLIEEQRTNFVGEQNLFDNTKWAPFWNTLSAGSGIAGLSSFIIGDENNAQYSQVGYSFPTALLSATTYCFSCYVKKNPNFNNILPLLRVNFLPVGVVPESFAGFFFNQATGQAVNGYTTTTSAISVQDFGTYFRTSFTFNTKSSATPTAVALIPSHGYLPSSSTLSGTTIEVAGIQVEQGEFPTSYIPTVGSQVTRLRDSVVIDGSNFVNLYNNKEGTLLVHGSTAGGKDAIPVLASIDNNSLNELIVLGRSTYGTAGGGFITGINSNNVIYLGADMYPTGNWNNNSTPNIMAVAYKSNDGAAAYNGVIVATTTSLVLPKPLQLQIGSNAGLGRMNGNIRKIGYWPKRLSNTTLRALTLSSLALGKYFAEEASLYIGPGPGVEVTRTSSATYFASGGKLTTAYYNRPRFDYDPVTNVCRGLLIEEQRTNFILNSQDFNSSTWSKINGVTVASNVIKAPDGTMTGDKLIVPVNGYSVATTTYNTKGDPYTFSVFMKAGERHQGYIAFGGAGNNQSVEFNLLNGTIVGIGNDPTNTFKASITLVGDGWYRCTLTGALPLTAVDGIFPLIACPVPAVGTEGLYVWGAQFEAGTFATSYIPTTNAAVTRTADTVQITPTNWQRIYNPEQGTFYTKVLPLSGSQAAAVIDVGDTYNSIHGIWKSGPGGDGSSGTSWNVFSYSDFLSANAQLTPLTANFVSTAGVANSGSGIAYTYGFNNFNASVNGSLSTIITQSTAVSAIPVMTGFNHLNGHVQTLEYYPIQLTNTQLTALTIQ